MMAALLGTVAIFMICCFPAPDGPLPMIEGNRGLAFESPNLWFGAQGGFGMNLLCLVGCAVMMTWLNAGFNILRSFSVTFVGLFLLMTAATPLVTSSFTGSALLCLVMLAAVGILLGAYGEPRFSRRIFLATVLVSAGALWQYAFLPYLLVIFIGIVQLRVATERTCVAALLGIATPWVLYCAFCPGWPPALHSPDIVNIFEVWPSEFMLHLGICVGLTFLTGTILGCTNMVRIFGFNARARAINGVLSTLSAMTALLCFIDFTNLPVYVVMLNACTAFQVGHFVSLRARSRGYLALILLPAAYLALLLLS